MAMIMISSKVKFWKNDGSPAVGWKIYTYEAGTTTPKVTWSDEAETVPNANPVVLDSRGEALVRLKGSYKIKLTDENDVEIWTVDNQTQYNQRDWSGLTATIAELNATNTSVLTKTADYAIIMTDRGKTIAVDATAATPTTVTLLNATAATNGYQITIKKIDKTNNVVNIDPATAQKIDGLDPFVLYDYNDFIKVLSDGSNWHVIAGKIRGSAIVTTTTPLAIDLGDENKTYLIDASSSAFVVNLPAINTIARGYRIGFKKTDSSSNAVTINGDGTEQIDGGSSVVISKQFDFIVLINDGSNWFVIGEYGSDTEDSLPRGYIDGLGMSRDVGDVDHDTLIVPGEARSADDTLNLKLTSNIVKRIDANWVAGTGLGGFPSALTLTASTWYHVFIIGKTDGTIDAGYDSDLTATNLLADATGYTEYRRVGSILTDVSLNITNYVQDTENLDVFYWYEPVISLTTTTATSGVFPLVVAVPLGIFSKAILSVYLLAHTGVGAFTVTLTIKPTYISSSATGFYFESVGHGIAELAMPAGGQVQVIANATKQINYIVVGASGSTSIDIGTHGWIDARGKQ